MLATKDGGAGFLTHPRAFEAYVSVKRGTKVVSKAKREQSPKEVLHVSKEGGAPTVKWLPPARPTHREHLSALSKHKDRARGTNTAGKIGLSL